jgi:hypothetical protein
MRVLWGWWAVALVAGCGGSPFVTAGCATTKPAYEPMAPDPEWKAHDLAPFDLDTRECERHCLEGFGGQIGKASCHNRCYLEADLGRPRLPMPVNQDQSAPPSASSLDPPQDPKWLLLRAACLDERVALSLTALCTRNPNALIDSGRMNAAPIACKGYKGGGTVQRIEVVLQDAHERCVYVVNKQAEERRQQVEREAEERRREQTVTDAKETNELVKRLQACVPVKAYEDAPDADLSGAVEQVRLMLDRLHVLSPNFPTLSANLPTVESVMSAVTAEQACRTKPQCMAKRAAKVADAEFEEEVVEPLCDAYRYIEELRADVQHEKDNPGGVVDLEVLHTLGHAIQLHQATIQSLTPVYPPPPVLPPVSQDVNEEPDRKEERRNEHRKRFPSPVPFPPLRSPPWRWSLDESRPHSRLLQQPPRLSGVLATHGKIVAGAQADDLAAGEAEGVVVFANLHARPMFAPASLWCTRRNSSAGDHLRTRCDLDDRPVTRAEARHDRPVEGGSEQVEIAAPNGERVPARLGYPREHRLPITSALVLSICPIAEPDPTA